MKKIYREQMGANANAMILLILKREDSYGYAIMTELIEISSGRIFWKEISLYPVLKKLQDKEMIESYWNLKDFDRPRKYYKILKKGLDELEAICDEQELMARAINMLLTRN